MTLKPTIGEASTPEWTKSSYSTDDGPDCVEVAWTKSSYSTADGPECIEVASTSDTIRVRDSKNIYGAQLAFAPTSWADFVAFARKG
ncbi:DUF397 domain-containing protein [Streptomyces celluloflavus]|uniref:DUF397 domain-containing protein n=1 Tax=Streptomyces celluloflavus TaxID=58344 RepID=UPI00345F92F6|nr:DUF397 domain-containing protein [Streptomyces celluloflavus]